MAASKCPCGPCEEVVDSGDWRCPECGKNLVDTKLEKAAIEDRPIGGDE